MEGWWGVQSLIGQQLGDYLLERELGRGSMGAVYYARQVSSGKPFAVKVLLDALASDMSFVTRFTREARIIARLHHPNIIRVYEAGRQGQHIYFVMEFFAGTTVGRLLKERGRLAVGYAIEIAAQAADALQYAHDEGRLIHRDIKPENLMVDRWCRVKMLDFGLARVEGLQSITRAGTVVGSLYYVPPEQLLGQPIDSRTDIYALGVSLYEMVTSQRPFRGQNLTDMSRAILSSTPIPPTQIEPSVPPELEAIINHAMARDLSQRYSHASELLADLRALQVTLAETPTSERGELAPPQSGAEPGNVTHPISVRPGDAQLSNGQTQPRPSLGPQMRDRS
ncbi:MAG: Serine/threonine protein kinase [Ktedonobacterales bacterium]|jgi:serine/threonine-protein kinase|nr:MAG: Serine/threonine protein kinase [Ktedonobacterales bacterium]